MDSLYDNLDTSGNLEIWKVYNDGEQELVFSDHNTIVSGLAAGMMSLFGGMYSNDITDYQIRWFQLGLSSYDSIDKTITQLSSPIASASYDPSNVGTLVLSSVPIRINPDTVDNQGVVLIPWNHIRRASPTSVLYTLVLDSQSGNDITYKEAGLFLRSPFSHVTGPTPVLAAYKTFTSITKRSEFSLIFKWTIYF